DHLATASGVPSRPEPGEATIWDVRTGQELCALKGHTSEVTSVAFSSDSRCLVSRDVGGKSIVWDVKTGKPLPTDPADVTPVSARSPDGQYLARIDGTFIRLIRPPDADEVIIRRARTAFDPIWHLKQAQHNEQTGQWYAAEFHVGQLLVHRPKDSA